MQREGKGANDGERLLWRDHDDTVVSLRSRFRRLAGVPGHQLLLHVRLENPHMAPWTFETVAETSFLSVCSDFSQRWMSSGLRPSAISCPNLAIT
jgi:hypothetical protein